jgi:hypothetical protein
VVVVSGGWYPGLARDADGSDEKLVLKRSNSVSGDSP